jgi:hypothetical protein
VSRWSPTWLVRSPQFNRRLGACHGLEVAFVFDTLGNQSSTFIVLVLALILLMALLKSEERYRKLVERMYLATNDR